MSEILSTPRIVAAVAGLLAALLLGGYVWHLRGDNARLRGENATLSYQLDEAQRIATENAAELDRYKAETERAMAAVVADRDAARRRADKPRRHQGKGRTR